MSSISFGYAKSSDALRISILLKTVYIQTYALEGITFEFSNFITKRFASESIEKSILENSKQFIIAYYNQNPIGVAEVFYNCKCSITNDSVSELSKLYLLERFYGRGIGYGLLKEVEKEVKRQEISKLNLEVYIKNTRAIDFYKKQGFITIGYSNFPMEVNTYKNLIMQKSLT